MGESLSCSQNCGKEKQVQYVVHYASEDVATSKDHVIEKLQTPARSRNCDYHQSVALNPSIASVPVTLSVEADRTYRANAREPAEKRRGKTCMLLSESKLFKLLPQENFFALMEVALTRTYSPGQHIVIQGDDGHEFFLIKSGQARVVVDGTEVNCLSVGDYFGEQALLKNTTRNASIIALSELSTLTVTRAQFQSYGLHEAFACHHRHAVQGRTDDVAVLPPSEKSLEERILIADAIRSNTNLTTFIGLSSVQIDHLVDVATKLAIAKGTELIRQGDSIADYFYVVQDGRFDITVVSKGDSLEEAESRAECVLTVSRGGSFGELALITSAPRAATVTAVADAVVWCIDRKSFKDVLAKTDDNTSQYLSYLDKVTVLDVLQDEEKRALVPALSEMHFACGEIVLEQGAPGDHLYILIEGEVRVIQDGDAQSTYSATTEDTPFFGERALLYTSPHAATIQVVSAAAKFLTLDRESCEMILFESLADLAMDNKSDRSSVVRVSIAGRSSLICHSGSLRKPIKKADLKICGLLGCGGFGSVELVEHVNTHETYALKALSKGHVVQCRLKNAAIQEKEIQLMCNSPFIIKLYETFQDDQMLYFLLELALGGELYSTYLKKSFHGNVTHAKFYAACVVCAFDHLHERKIIYRDLKPENLLLNEHGYAKLTDMGLAKVTAGKTFTSCGTPDYFAPEMITCKGHTRAVDWWTLGILIYELMAGRPPFEARTQQQTFKKITAGFSKVSVSKAVKGPVEDLIAKLLRGNAPERLPMLQGGSNRIKRHGWYKGFDWEAFGAQLMIPPYIPSVTSSLDLSNVFAENMTRPPVVKYVDDGSGWDEGFATSQ
eukprot:TRINITY_DN30138_c0_g1_i1.p1 TRINITY_DN30138_c0_g1~~TRINITY_DN30138_c0_g1_i1.p1  ORF type:complete len:839 (+),score=90.11 TRINITY_DN30138_c0_g1_i1:101-2617(+)